MLLNRALNNQLHLHDEGNPAWGGISPSRKYQTAPKNFAEELRDIASAFVSDKLDEIKLKLTEAASSGNKSRSFFKVEIDNYSLEWLNDQGLKVEDKWSGTREDGYGYYEISW